MNGKLTPYLEYKDSGLPWLGRVPVHWGVERAKWLFQHMQRPVNPDDQVVTCFRDGTVTLRKNRRTSGFTESLQEIGYQGVRQGDLVIHAMDAFAGAVGVSDSDGKCTPVYAVCQPNSYSSAYYYAYIVREMARTQFILALSRGIRERSTDFRFETFAVQPLPIPPKSEQDAIVKFLARQDNLIRRYIRAKRRLIELLNEQKQAIIQQAVTRGLDPNVRLISSEVEWLGGVPEHWTIKRIKHLLVSPLKYGANLPAELTDRDLPRYIRITDIDKYGNLIDSTFRSLPQDIATPYLLEDGDILLARSGATVGKAFLYSTVHGPAAHAGYLIRVRANQRMVRPSYLFAFMQSSTYWSWIASMTIQATIQNVSAEKYAKLPLTVPPLDEQDQILEAIKRESEPIERALAKAYRELDLLREYRTRLIADIITGKLDVRGVELEEIEDLVSLDEGAALEGEPQDDEDMEEVEEDADADD